MCTSKISLPRWREYEPSLHLTMRALDSLMGWPEVRISQAALKRITFHTPSLSKPCRHLIVFSTLSLSLVLPSSSCWVASSSISSSYVSPSKGRDSTERKFGNFTKWISLPRSVWILGTCVKRSSTVQGRFHLRLQHLNINSRLRNVRHWTLAWCPWPHP